ncbi:zinc ribbon domain-containing protein [Selenomonas flueggei]|uniref:zinc ribbon domain-containing protein n=1 Tax=Selenomonas flueggei TaxID=135080 RepID=UPI0026740AAE|nr:zinc ribbon domain-containing protein [Selenomonas flueggei]
MKSCEKCGASIDENVKFCPLCGAPQEQAAAAQEDAVKTADAEDVQQPVQTAEAEENVKKCSKLRENLVVTSYISAGAVAVSVFMPWISLGKMIDVTIMDISKGLMLAIIFVGAASAHALLKKKNYVLAAAMGHALLIFAVIAFIRYQSAISELKKTFFGAMAGSAISIDWGAMFFFVGAINLCAVSVLLYVIDQLLPQGGALTGDVLFCTWKELVRAKVKLASIEVPAWIYSLVIGILLVLLFSQSGMNRMIH